MIGMSAFGLGRALPLLYMAWVLNSSEEGFCLMGGLQHWKPVVHLVNGLVLAFTGSFLLIAGIIWN
jgi:hypothetical protein